MEAVGRGRGWSTGRRPHGGRLSATLVRWLDEASLAGRTVLDVGTGTGALALHLAARARRVLGIDVDAGALVEAQRQARRAGLGNVVFVVADAEQADYRALARPDAIVAHLCMSDAIVARAGAGLDPGGLLAFAAFHTDQWRETGQVSRFAYEPERARAVLEGRGFRIERMEVERDVTTFASADEARAATAGYRARWEPDGRWAAWTRFVDGGGRTLTRSRLVVEARRDGTGP
ncbi:MAG TPA: class I SAM-dependent methyltransferase [Methylomirabilota bacterium]|nr:class I SAM-dependent methyltransferase [Methylomirabilota bacterium]